MLKTVLIPSKNQLILDIPDNFIGKQIEVIAFAIDEVATSISDVPLTHFASQKVLAKDWLTPQEDSAWQLL
jgi:hypothetical protein